MLADASNDAVLVMNVQTAIARADDIAAAVIDVVGKYRAERRMLQKPVLAVWVGADQSISDLLSGAGIPNYQTGGDAVLGFMHLVRHREVVEALAQVPPAMPSEFVPDTDAARPTPHSCGRNLAFRRRQQLRITNAGEMFVARNDRRDSDGTGPRTPPDLVDTNDDPVALGPVTPLDSQRRIGRGHSA